MLILYVALPHRAYFSTVGAILAKLYANSLLVLFNSRIRIAGSRNWPSHARGVSSDESAAHTARVFSPRRAAMALGGVHIQEQVVVHADESVVDDQASLNCCSCHDCVAFNRDTPRDPLR